MRGRDGKQFSSEKERGNIWRDYMERIMNEEYDWDDNMEGDMVEVLVVCVSKEEMLVNKCNKTAKGPGPSDVSLELIAASGEQQFK